jgi:hypothetical protein
MRCRENAVELNRRRPRNPGGRGRATSALLDASCSDALSASVQHALGIPKLEDSVDSVGGHCARALMPLWQARGGGTRQSHENRNPVLTQMEATLTRQQLQAIAGMQLTLEDLRTWAESQGLSMDVSQLAPEARSRRYGDSNDNGV